MEAAVCSWPCETLLLLAPLPYLPPSSPTRPLFGFGSPCRPLDVLPLLLLRSVAAA